MDSRIENLYKVFLSSSGISTDTRGGVEGKLYFGLRGEHFDGSAFGDHALDAGAHAVVVRPGTCRPDPRVFISEDPLRTLQDLARHHRRQFIIPVIAITGSNGKTSTKELMGRLLSTRLRTMVTVGNLNNHIGVPLTLLTLKPEHEIAIVEMGANHIGEIRELCGIARPTHGLITNIGKAHLEGFGDVEGVKRAKSELYDFLAEYNGTAFVNMDERYLSQLSEHVHSRVSYRVGSHAEYEPMDYTFTTDQSVDTITVGFVDRKEAEWKSTSTLFGAFNAANLAAAIAIGLFFDVPGDAICDAIASYVPQNNRMQRVTVGGRTIILDAYNANPSSMALAIRSFGEIQHPYKVMILGSMMELGDFSAQEHLEIAQLAAVQKDTRVILVGDQFSAAAGQHGMQWFASVDVLKPVLSTLLPDHALLLVKGSRAMRLEDLLRELE